jgi:hypothetical protein
MDTSPTPPRELAARLAARRAPGAAGASALAGDDAQPRAPEAELHELLAGLRDSPKHVAPRYLYDAQGSRLFERICEQPEYYLTRIETAILRENVGAIAASIGERALQLLPRVEEAAHDRPLRDVHGLGHLFVAHAFDLTHDDDASVIRRKCVEGRLKSPRDFAAANDLAGISPASRRPRSALRPSHRSGDRACE